MDRHETPTLSENNWLHKILVSVIGKVKNVFYFLLFLRNLEEVTSECFLVSRDLGPVSPYKMLAENFKGWLN